MTIIRFWAKVKKNGPIPTHRPELGQCWMWSGSQTNGYGKFIHRGRAIYAHRFADAETVREATQFFRESLAEWYDGGKVWTRAEYVDAHLWDDARDGVF